MARPERTPSEEADAIKAAYEKLEAQRDRALAASLTHRDLAARARATKAVAMLNDKIAKHRNEEAKRRL